MTKREKSLRVEITRAMEKRLEDGIKESHKMCLYTTGMREMRIAVLEVITKRMQDDLKRDRMKTGSTNGVSDTIQRFRATIS